jgi:hypothetical protein
MQEKMEQPAANRSLAMKPTVMKRILLSSTLAVFAFSLVIPSVSQAQKEEKPKVKTFDFSGDDIDGELVKPDGEFVDPRKFATHTNLIRIRKDFINEILKSAEDL